MKKKLAILAAAAVVLALLPAVSATTQASAHGGDAPVVVEIEDWAGWATPGASPLEGMAALSPGLRMPGGTYLEGVNGGYCTAGFPLRNMQGQRFMLTAGHCSSLGSLYTRPDDRNWNANPNRQYVGSISFSNYGAPQGDAALIPLSQAGYTVNTQLGDAHLLPGFKDPVNGMRVCKTGMTVNYRCDLEIVDSSITIQHMGTDKIVKNTFKFCPVSGSAPSTLGGDSGGPVFVWNSSYTGVTAVGVVSAMGGSGCGYATRVSDALTAWGLVIDDYGR